MSALALKLCLVFQEQNTVNFGQHARLHDRHLPALLTIEANRELLGRSQGIDSDSKPSAHPLQPIG